MKIVSSIIAIFIALTLAFIPKNCYAQDQDSIFLWYGNVDGSALNVNINERVYIDLYIYTPENVYAGDGHFCLGASDQYIDSLLSHNEGIFYYPFTEWDLAVFLEPESEVPGMPEGWSSQSFLGFARLYGYGPWLHYDAPTLGMSYVVKTADNPANIGDDANAIGPGLNTNMTYSWSGDTLGYNNFFVSEQFSLFHFDGGGYVEGVVSDEQGDPIENVSVINENTGKEVLTDDDGFYHMGLYPGTHSFVFSHLAFIDTTIAEIEVTVDQTIQLNVTLLEIPIGIDIDLSSLPDDITLSQNYPNPFNPTTTISYTLPEPLFVSLAIYDILGRNVQMLVDEYKQASLYNVKFKASHLASGIYFYRLQAGDFAQSKRMVLLK